MLKDFFLFLFLSGSLTNIQGKSLSIGFDTTHNKLVVRTENNNFFSKEANSFRMIIVKEQTPTYIKYNINTKWRQ